MKKNYKTLKLFSVLAILLITVGARAQSLSFTVNNGVNYQCFNGGMNTASITVTSSPPGTTNYTWTVVSPPCPVTYTTSTPNGSSINMTFPCPGMYSISCVSLNGSTANGVQFSQFFIYANPTINIINSSPTLCLGSTATLSASGANTYTWSSGIAGPQVIITPSVSTCYSVSGTNTQGCISTVTTCVILQTTNVLISPSSQTVCKGSSATLSVSGTAASYSWNTGATTSTLNVLPNFTTSYTVSGTGSNGCTGMDFATVYVDSTCSDVWPGDANSDGGVTNSDVFEIGLAFSNTGSARTPGGNSYTSQYANNWSGTVSSGKNKCHADCNGDGTVNMADTVAIFNNFSLTHTFKSSGNSASDPDISITANQNTAFTGQWNKADILLGSGTAPMSQLYGVAFDLMIDPALIEPNSYYLVYNSSFLNQNNQNVQFKKPDFTTNKIYAASVRTDHADVSGNGKIAEIWFKVKSDAPDNSIINISLANASKVNASGTSVILTTSAASISVSSDATGIKGNYSLQSLISLFPNPATNFLHLESSKKNTISYIISDILGKQIVQGEFTNSANIDISELSAGSYIVSFNSGSLSTYKKIIIEK